MINNPVCVIIDGERFDINTDFRVALKCEEVAQDENIDDSERALAIIFLLFGDKGIDETKKWDKLMTAAMKYLSCGQNIENINSRKNEADMDYIQDERYIKTSFLQEYNIDLSKCKLHWWDFYDLLNGLTENAILSRVRYIRNYDVSQIKDSKEKQKIIKQKQQVALKKKYKEPTQEQLESKKRFLQALNLKQ